MISRNNVVRAARKKYIRELVKGRRSFNQNFKKNSSEQGVLTSASAMIEYYNTAYRIGLHAKERLNEVMSGESEHSANDIVTQLLLVGSRSMHLNITSDYELKE
jgi:hypothetical protein